MCQLLIDGPPKRDDKILLKFIDCSYQTLNNSDDCGLYVIAKAVAEALNMDTTTQKQKKIINFTVDNHKVFVLGSCYYCMHKIRDMSLNFPISNFISFKSVSNESY